MSKKKKKAKKKSLRRRDRAIELACKREIKLAERAYKSAKQYCRKSKKQDIAKHLTEL